MTQSIFGSPLKWTPVQTQSDANVRAIQELDKTQDSMVENFGGITKSVDEVFADAQRNMQVNGLVSLSSMPVESLNDPKTMLLHKLNLVAQGSSIGGFDNVGEYAKAFDLEKANLLAQDAERREFYKKQQEDLNRIKANQFQAAYIVANDNSGLFNAEQKQAAAAAAQGLGKEGIFVDKEGNVVVNEGILLGIFDGMGKGSKQVIDNANSNLDLQEVLGKSAFERSKYGSVMQSLLKMKAESKIMGGYATQRNDKESASKYSQVVIDTDKAINIYLADMEKNDPVSANFFRKYRDKWSTEFETGFDKIYSKQVATGLDYAKHADRLKLDTASLAATIAKNEQTFNLGLKDAENNANKNALEAQKVQIQIAKDNDPFNNALTQEIMKEGEKLGLGNLIRKSADASGKTTAILDTNVAAGFLQRETGDAGVTKYVDDFYTKAYDSALKDKNSVLHKTTGIFGSGHRLIDEFTDDLNKYYDENTNKPLTQNQKKFLIAKAIIGKDTGRIFFEDTDRSTWIKRGLTELAEIEKTQTKKAYDTLLNYAVRVTGNSREQVLKLLPTTAQTQYATYFK